MSAMAPKSRTIFTMNKPFVVLLTLLSPALPAAQPQPLSPAESARSFQLPPGYKLELVVSEPEIKEPVVCAFDGNGRMFIAEMRTYMQDIDGKDELTPNSCVSLHWSSKGDGVYDRHTVFADKLLLPRMILPLDAGRLLICETNTNDLYLYTDTDGDGVSDKKELWWSGGPRGRNLEHQPSGLIWAIDNGIYSTYNAHRLRWTPGGVVQEPTANNLGQWGLGQDDHGKLFFSNAGGERGPLSYQIPIVYGSLQPKGQFAPGFEVVWPLVGLADVQGGKSRFRPEDGVSETLFGKGDTSLTADIAALAKDKDPMVAGQVFLTASLLKWPNAKPLADTAIASTAADGLKKIAAAVFAPPAPPKMDGAKLTADQEKLFKAGGEIYNSLCATCHGADAKGVPMAGGLPGVQLAPALAASKTMTGPANASIYVLLHGLTGDIEGRKYEGQMIAMATNDDRWIASVLSYVRNNFGNRASFIAPEEVGKLRAATKSRTQPWTIAELRAATQAGTTATNGAAGLDRSGWKVSASHRNQTARDAIDGDPATRYFSGGSQVAGHVVSSRAAAAGGDFRARPRQHARAARRPARLHRAALGRRKDLGRTGGRGERQRAADRHQIPGRAGEVHPHQPDRFRAERLLVHQRAGSHHRTRGGAVKRPAHSGSITRLKCPIPHKECPLLYIETETVMTYCSNRFRPQCPTKNPMPHQKSTFPREPLIQSTRAARWVAHAPSRVVAGALAGHSPRARLIGEGADDSTRGRGSSARAPMTACEGADHRRGRR